MRIVLFLVLIVFAGGFLIFQSRVSKGMDVSDTVQSEMPENLPVATLAGGCFWCLESEFRALEGVVFTRVGYEGGDLENPSYRDIMTGETGHAEAIEVYYNPALISYTKLVDYFLRNAHDPTQKNRQGVDVGPQYRSAIFYHDEEQKQITEDLIAKIDAEKLYKNPIVTEIAPKQTFWLAEEYHQQYYEKYEEEKGRPHIRVLLKDKKKASN